MTPAHQLAENYLRFTGVSVFLTGKAGTGKTTFLKTVVPAIPKQQVVAAPTGVAAMNAGGVTLHSLFQLPFGPYLPIDNVPTGIPEYIDWRNRRTLMRNVRISKAKRRLLQRLELLVIDEVSMVRADMMDAIDRTLRSVRRIQRPFGGVQVLLIGDLRQLSPVVKQNEWNILKQYYRSPYFFDAHVMKEVDCVNVELKTVYRQRDEEFVGLLNRLRNKQVNNDDMALLESRYKPDFTPNKEDQYITLCSHNHQADAINAKRLNELKGDAVDLAAVVKGDFPEHSYPADVQLRLKVGAQVMFVRNDIGDERRYYNGKIGIVDAINEDGIHVTFSDGSDDVMVEPVQWDNVKFEVDDDNKVKENVMGSFLQYPLRLAWAITIHKSQGLTFDRAIIDAGASFAPGQVYVALSRLTSLEGLVLQSRITPESVKVDDDVSDYLNAFKSDVELDGQLELKKNEYARSLVVEATDIQNFRVVFTPFYRDIPAMKIKNKEALLAWADQVNRVMVEWDGVHKKLLGYLNQNWPMTTLPHSSVMKRCLDGCTYFLNLQKNSLYTPLVKDLERLSSEKATKRVLEEMKQLLVVVQQMGNDLTRTSGMLEAMMAGQALDSALSIRQDTSADNYEKPAELQKAEKVLKKKKPKKEVGATYKETLAMALGGMSIEEIAKKRELAASTIEGHFRRLINQGDLPLEMFVDEVLYKQITQAIEELPEESGAKDVKAALGDACSFAQIFVVMVQLKQEVE